MTGPVEQYLILHKVRGEPAFDIAEPALIGTEQGWIISTSGWRAYPYWSQPLNLLIDWAMADIHGRKPPEMPDDCPEHFGLSQQSHIMKSEISADLYSDIIAALSPQSIGEFKRRSFK